VDDDRARPKFFSVTLLMPDGEKTISVADDQHIWEAALAHSIKIPALCQQGWCLACAGLMACPGEVDQSDSVAFFPQDRQAGFTLLCTAKPRSDLCIVTHQAVEMRMHRLRNGLPSPYSVGLKP